MKTSRTRIEMDKLVKEAKGLRQYSGAKNLYPAKTKDLNIKKIKKLLMDAWVKLDAAAAAADIKITAGMRPSKTHAVIANKIFDLQEQIANLNKSI